MVDIREAPGWIWAVVMLVIFAAVGVLVSDELGATLQPNSTASSVTANGTLAIANVTKQLPTLGIIMGVMLIIGAVVMMSVYFGQKGGYM